MTDIRMPPGQSDEGIEFAAQLRETVPEIGVIILSQFLEPEYAVRLFEQGAAGRAYLLKERIATPVSWSARSPRLRPAARSPIQKWSRCW